MEDAKRATLEFQEWTPESRMTQMLYDLDTKSSLHANIQQFAQGIIDSPKNAEELTAVIGQSLQQNNLQEALYYLDANTALSVNTKEQKIFATVGLVAMQELGAQSLIRMAYKIDSNDPTQRSAAYDDMLEEIYSKVLPEGKTLETLRQSPSEYSYFVKAIEARIENGDGVPSKADIAQIFVDYDADLKASVQKMMAENEDLFGYTAPTQITGGEHVETGSEVSALPIAVAEEERSRQNGLA